jgi:hypothetical protein
LAMTRSSSERAVRERRVSQYKQTLSHSYDVRQEYNTGITDQTN